MQNKSKKIGLTIRVIIVVSLFFGTIIALAALATNSEYVSEYVLRRIAQGVANKGFEVNLSDIKGKFIDKITIKKVKIKKNSDKFAVLLDNIAFGLNFERLYTKGVVSFDIDAENAVISGLNISNERILNIPTYNDLTCFAYFPAEIEISSLNIKKIRYVFNKLKDTELVLAPLKITPTNNVLEKNLVAYFKASWKAGNLGVASFSGTLNQKAKKINGTIDVAMAGQKLKSEINVSRKKGKNFEVSGYLSESVFDTAPISRWLAGLWQDNFPFSFDGKLSCSGSWLYNSNVGFLGNLSGKCEKLHVVAMGLFIQVLELNNTWQYLNGTISINDTGSRLFDFPAILNGKIDSVFFDNERKWDLNFICKNADAASITATLPWGIKYGLNLPQLKGEFDLSVSVIGKDPNTTLRIASQKLVSGSDNEMAEISGTVSWLYSEKQKHVEAIIDVENIDGVPRFFSRFALESALNDIKKNYNETVKLNYRLFGDPYAETSLEGAFTGTEAGAIESILLFGSFLGGEGSLKLESKEKQIAEAHKVNIYDLLLLK
ncbi:MAG: hypothetical protein PHF29_07845 [Candidatus Riflebacteria bacterium]|nr:hypothetical protein [Candidatus Riflebacteria bacterium]